MVTPKQASEFIEPFPGDGIPSTFSKIMTHAIGAHLIGFSVGGPLLLLQIFSILGYRLFANQVEPDVPELITWVVAVLIGGTFFLAVAYWVSCVFLVFPVSFLFRALQIPAPVGSVIGAFVAGTVFVSVVKIPGSGNSMHWPFYFYCSAVPLITGAITGYMLAKFLEEGEQQLGNGDAETAI